MSDVYALLQKDRQGQEWVQEFDSRDEAVNFRAANGGVLVVRRAIPGKPGLWWLNDD